MMKFPVFFALTVFLVTPALAQGSVDNDAVVTLSYENDIFAGNDSNYTSGVRLAYSSSETTVPRLLELSARAVPFFLRQGHARWGVAVGQNMYTPNDITVTNPPSDDQPYAGWLYASASLAVDNQNRLDIFQITGGVVGPASGAQQTQKFIHRLVDSPRPMGWKNQLHNEPGLILTYQRTWRNLYGFTPFRRGYAVDLSPAVGGNVGNIYTDASLSVVARFGKNLPSDYGPPLIRPSLGGSDFFVPGHDFDWYVFTGLQGQAVARNIFLDGNMIGGSSPHVDKENFVASAQVGVAIIVNRARVAYTHVFRTDEFETQRKSNQYGVVTVSARF